MSLQNRTEQQQNFEYTEYKIDVIIKNSKKTFDLVQWYLIFKLIFVRLLAQKKLTNKAK